MYDLTYRPRRLRINPEMRDFGTRNDTRRN